MDLDVTSESTRAMTVSPIESPVRASANKIAFAHADEEHEQKDMKQRKMKKAKPTKMPSAAMLSHLSTRPRTPAAYIMAPSSVEVAAKKAATVLEAHRGPGAYYDANAPINSALGRCQLSKVEKQRQEQARAERRCVFAYFLWLASALLTFSFYAQVQIKGGATAYSATARRGRCICSGSASGRRRGCGDR